MFRHAEHESGAFFYEFVSINIKIDKIRVYYKMNSEKAEFAFMHAPHQQVSGISSIVKAVQ